MEKAKMSFIHYTAFYKLGLSKKKKKVPKITFQADSTGLKNRCFEVKKSIKVEKKNELDAYSVNLTSMHFIGKKFCSFLQDDMMFCPISR